MYRVWRVVRDIFIQEFIYVQGIRSSAGELYSRIYKGVRVWRVVQDNCIQEYKFMYVYEE